MPVASVPDITLPMEIWYTTIHTVNEKGRMPPKKKRRKNIIYFDLKGHCHENILQYSTCYFIKETMGILQCF